ncbi:MAG: putative periplasmic or secreted lipoprotein [Planctomycetota bacterium]|nr:putative periplasmic or secreted lipoprotein [Planctomycetota bacterium]
MSLSPQRGIVIGLAVLSVLSHAARAQVGSGAAPRAAAQADSSSVEIAILNALRTHPITSGYAFRTGRKDGRIVLSGRVGTKEIHDVAIRLALSLTSAIDDRIIIDTAEANRVAGVPLARTTVMGTATPLFGNAGSAYLSGIPPLVYPPPLFGRIDDPFYGFEPPLISYPPWWGAVAGRRADPYAAPALDPDSPIGPDPGADRSTPPPPPSPAPMTSAPRAVEMTLDPRGVAVLRGSVPRMSDRIGIGQKVARMEGVKEVINLLDVQDDADLPIVPRRAADTPPPPPTPANEPQGPARIAPAQTRVPARENPNPPDRPGDDAAVSRRLATNLERRPLLAGTAVQSSVRDGVAYLSGKVPSALEAMIAFRAAQQTVGVHDIDDRLAFTVPDGQSQNPLIARGRPEDVEPYLEAQVRRQLGDKAHLDRVRVTGDRIEIKGTVVNPADRARIEAILRSMPLLRGYTLDATLVPE